MQNQLKVNGMMCNHCKASVTAALEAINAKNINIDLNTKIVTFSDVDIEAAKQAIEEIGYDVE